MILTFALIGCFEYLNRSNNVATTFRVSGVFR